MIIIKDSSIELNALHPALALALSGTVVPVLKEAGSNTILTSGSEQSARHGVTSLHYSGCAVDIRIRDPYKGVDLFDAKEAVDLLNKHLSIDFDVILESDHIHMEYQPKRR